MAGEGVRLDLQVGLDLAYLQKELRTVGANLTGQQITLPIVFDRRDITTKTRALAKFIGGKKFNVEINTNLKAELGYAKKLGVELANLSARNTKNLAAQAVGRGGGFINEAQFSAFLNRLTKEPLAAIRSGFEKAGVQMQSAGKGTVKELRDSIISGLPQVTRDIANGLIAGLDPGMKESGRKGARNFIDAYKSATGIASPSKVFKALGKFSADGLEIGFLNGLEQFQGKAVAKMRQIIALLKLEIASLGEAGVRVGSGAAFAGAQGGRQYMSPIGPLPHGSREPWAWNRQASRYEPFMAQPGQFRGAGVPPMRSRYPFAPMPPVMGTITSPSMFGVSRPALPPAGAAAATREAALALRELEARARSAARAATVFAEDAARAARREALQAVSGQMSFGGLPAGVRGLLPPAGGNIEGPPSVPPRGGGGGGFFGNIGTLFSQVAGKVSQMVTPATKVSVNTPEVIRDLDRIIAAVTKATRLGGDIKLNLDASNLEQQIETTFKKLDKRIAKQQRKLRKLEIGSPEFLARAERSGVLQGQRERGEAIAQAQSLVGQSLAFESGSAAALGKRMEALALQAQQINPNTQEWVEFQRQIGAIQTELKKADQAAEAIQLREDFGAFRPGSLNQLEAKLKMLRIEAGRIIPNTGEWRTLNREIQTLEGKIERINRKPLTMRQRAGAAGGAFLYGGGLGGGVGSAVGGIAGGLLGGVEGAFAGAGAGQLADNLSNIIAQTAVYTAQIDRQRIALKNLVPNNNEYQQSLQFIAETSKSLAIPQEQINQGFTRIAASVIGAGGNVRDAQMAFDGIAAGIRGTGGSLQDMQGALLATAQVFSKGKVSAEELRGQIGERLPGAFTLFAEAIGKTPQELDKMLEKGEVGLNEFMLFIDALRTRYGEAALQMAASTQAAGDRLVTATSAMREAVGRELQPVGAAFQEAFAGFIEDSTPGFVGAASVIADAAGVIARALEGARKNIAQFSIAFGAVVATIVAANLPTIITGITAAIGALTIKLAGLATVLAIAAPWVAVAAGLTAIGIAAYNASQETSKYSDIANKTSATSDELATATSEAEAELAKVEAQIKETGVTSKAAQREMQQLKAQIDALKGRHQVILEVKQIFTGSEGVPEGYKVINGKLAYQVPGSGMGWLDAGTSKPIAGQQGATKFPQAAEGAGAGGKRGKADRAAERAARIQAEIQGIQRQTALTQQLTFLDELIAQAQSEQNQERVAALRLEEQRLQLAYQLADQLARAETQGQREALLAKAMADEMRLRVGAAIELNNKEEERQKQFQDLLAGLDRQSKLNGIVNEQARAFRQIEFDIVDLRKQNNNLTEEQIDKYRRLARAAADLRTAAEAELTSRIEAATPLGGRGLSLGFIGESGEQAVSAFDRAIGAGKTEEQAKADAQYFGQLQNQLTLLESRNNAIKSSITGIGDAFGTAMTAGVASLIDGTASAEEVFSNFLKSVGQTLLQAAQQMIATYIAIGIARIFAGLGGGGGEKGLNLTDIKKYSTEGPISAGMFSGFANGGIAPGGFKAFANGGIATSPTLGLIGEGRYNEAIVPLPDGKSIPVMMRGEQPSSRDLIGGGSMNQAMAPILNMSFESTTINGVEYVSRDQLEQAMMDTRKAAAREGATRGATLAIDKLQQSPSTRRRIGLS